MQCRLCRHENRDDALFCGACGQALPPPCPACGAAVDPGNRFCDQCGAAQVAADATRPPPAQRAYTPRHLADKILTTRAALEGERKQVTVLFCDIANSIELARRLGAEVMYERINGFFDLALSEVHQMEGTINQFLGDGFMALFGAPLAHEDHVRRALLAALGIRQKLKEAAADGNAALDAIELRMGLNTGSVVVGKIGDNLRMDYTAIGDTTNIAARLEGIAAPGQICVSEAVHEAGHAHFHFAPLGRRTIKGVVREVEVFELTRARAREASEPGAKSLGIGSPLVGREREVATVQRVLEGLGGGTGGVLILSGEPGTGKSRLAAEIRRQCDGDRVRWLEGRAVSFGRSLSYLPFIEIIKECFAIGDDDGEEESWRKLERGIADLFGERAAQMQPYLATVLALRLPAAFEERVRYLDSKGLGAQVFLSMRQLFERLAQRQALVLQLEDWHWADQSSIELAEHLLPLTASTPLLMFFATRPSYGDAMPRIREIAAERAAGALTEVVLAPLGEAHSGTLVANLVGSADLPLALRDLILRKTEGNPFFIEEVIRALVSDGVLVRDARDSGWQLVEQVGQVKIPDTVQGLILARIDRLHEEAKQSLKLASVIGRNFFSRVLAAIDPACRHLERNLAELEQVELIRQRQPLPEVEYVFKHALVQEATYGSILADNRRAIHRRVAQAIETLFAERLEEFTSVLAYHYSLAEDWIKAQEYLFKAGDWAGRMSADTEALEHFRQAEAAYVKAFGDKLDALQRAALARKMGAALYGTGHYEPALEQFRRALAQLGLDYPSSPSGVRRAIVKYLAGHLLRRLRARLNWPAARTIAPEQAQELSGICHSMSWMDYFINKERMLLDCLMQLHVGENSADTVAEAQGLSSLGFGFMTFNALAISRRYHNAAVALAQRTGHPAAIAFAAHALGFLNFYGGRWDEADANFILAATTYRNAGDIHRAGGAVLMRSFVVDLRGDIAQGIALAGDLARDGEDSADPQLASWAHQIRGYAELASGPLDQAVSNLRKGVAIAARIPSWDNFNYQMSVLGKCLVLQGKLDEAVAIFDEALRVIKTENFHLPFDLVEVYTGLATCRLALLERGDGAARAGRARAARRSCKRALRLARRQPAWLAQALRLRGTCAWLSGQAGAAHRYWRLSVAQAERAAFPIERAKTLLEIGHRSADGALVEQAAEIFHQAGAQVFAALALHARAQLHARTGADAATSVREYGIAIAALVAVNADGAAALARDEQARLAGGDR